jgi:hypothetical protein
MEGVVSLGGQTYSGIPLVIEFSEGFSTSSSPVNGPGEILNFNTDGRRVITFVLAKQSCNNYAHC